MKHAPELDPELRGLLEEIAADPRSRLRLAPRHALRSWYLTDEIARPRDLDATAAERHLVAAHREALAALYCEASVLAYWQAPQFYSARPAALLEESAEARLERASARYTTRVSRCLVGPGPGISMSAASGMGRSWAEAALALVPSSAARLSLAFHLRSEQPRAALDLFLRVARTTSDSEVRMRGWSAAGATAVVVEDFDTALECYREASSHVPTCLPSALNVALCVLSMSDAQEYLGKIEEWSPNEEQLSEPLRVLRGWLAHETDATRRVRSEARRLRRARGAVAERLLNEYA